MRCFYNATKFPACQYSCPTLTTRLGMPPTSQIASPENLALESHPASANFTCKNGFHPLSGLPFSLYIVG
jgi:hypothetical protein